MYEQGGDSDFWWRWLLLMAIVVLSLAVFNAVMRKIFKVERPKLFSYNHVNDKHKKVDWAIRIMTMVAIIIVYMINSARIPAEGFFYFQTWFILFLFVLAQQTAKAIMERKYAENINRYKVTVSETVFILAIFLSLYLTDFWGLI
ncbi:DUF4181 domain-containing protein [Planococcus sp. MERTA32b]|nr:DUF4181 domain-containing protein [Planococcus sp. MER TA 32b]